MVVRSIWAVTLVAALAASSQAVIFSGISTLGTTDGVSSLIGTNGINFSLSDGNSINGATRVPIDLKFTVTADAGFDLSSILESPVGFVRNQGVEDLTISFVGSPAAGPFHTTTTAPVGTKVSLSDMTFSPLGGTTYLVDAHLILTSLHTVTGGPSVASLTQLAFKFNEQPVPEPASLAVIGIGLAGVITKSRKRKSN